MTNSEENKFWYDKLGVKYSEDKSILIKSISKLENYEIYNGCSTIECYAFQNCSIKTITIPNSVVNINAMAFFRCHLLEEIIIPNSVTFIGFEAFSESSLKYVHLPKYLTYIEDRMFKGCNSLLSIEIPDSVERIGERAFYRCTSLRTISIPNSVQQFGGAFLNGCNSLANIYFNNELIKINDIYLFTKDNLLISSIIKKEFVSIDIPDYIEIIGNGAFSGANNVQKVNLHDKIYRLEDWSFFGCSKLYETIEIPNSVNYIGLGAFMYCHNLNYINIPLNIGNYSAPLS